MRQELFDRFADAGPVDIVPQKPAAGLQLRGPIDNVLTAAVIAMVRVDEDEVERFVRDDLRGFEGPVLNDLDAARILFCDRERVFIVRVVPFLAVFPALGAGVVRLLFEEIDADHVKPGNLH